MEAERSALIVVDMLNPYDHEDAERLVESVGRVVPSLAELVERARRDGIEIVYVNDNYGDWNSSQEELAKRALHGARPDLIEPVLPPDDAAFVIKARHSIFYGTPLEYLLGQKGVDHVVLAGQVTEQCILYSALDAYVRELKVSVPTDAVAHIEEHLADAALEMMEQNMSAELAPCADIDMKGGDGG